MRARPSTSGHCGSQVACRRPSERRCSTRTRGELIVVDRPADALEASTDALSCWREAGDRVGLGASLRNRVEVLRLANEGEAALAAGRAAIAILEPEGESVELARAYSVVAQMHMVRSEGPACFTAARRGLEIAEVFGDDEVQIHLLTTYGTQQLCVGDLAGFAALEDALRRAQAAGLDDPTGPGVEQLDRPLRAIPGARGGTRTRAGSARVRVLEGLEGAHAMHRGDVGRVPARLRSV